MKKNLLFVFCPLMSIALTPIPSVAFSTNVATRSCSEKLTSDNVLIYSVNFSVPRSWDASSPPVIYEASDAASGKAFKVYMIDNTVAIDLSLPNNRGITQSLLRYESMDPIHSATSTGPNINQRVKFDLYIGSNILWVEARNSVNIVSPVRNTVYFVGMNISLWNKEIIKKCSSYHYTNSESMKDDIQKNYSDKYYPDSTPGLIEYTKKDAAALLLLQQDTD